MDIFTVLPGLISDYIHNKVWDEVTNPCPNLSGVAVKVWEYINISSHTLLDMGSLNHAEMKVNPYL